MLHVFMLSNVVALNKCVIKTAKLKSLELLYASTIYLKNENLYNKFGENQAILQGKAYPLY
jgi:hypothetical protein